MCVGGLLRVSAPLRTSHRWLCSSLVCKNETEFCAKQKEIDPAASHNPLFSNLLESKRSHFLPRQDFKLQFPQVTRARGRACRRLALWLWWRLMVGHQQLLRRQWMLRLVMMGDGRWEPVFLWGAPVLAAAVRRPGGQKWVTLEENLTTNQNVWGPAAGGAIQLHEPDVCKYEGSYYVTYINVEKVLFKKIFKSHSQFDNKLTLRDGGWPVLQSRVSVFDELGMRTWI